VAVVVPEDDEPEVSEGSPDAEVKGEAKKEVKKAKAGKQGQGDLFKGKRGKKT